MFGPIRAVAIDDQPSHLLAITTGLSASGIPCMGFWFDRDTSELLPKPPEGGLSFLRLVFMDLNLAELAGIPEPATLCAGVMSVLRQLISKDGGPYLLVFWTQVSTKVADVKKMLYERLERVEQIPCPIAVVELAKGPFIVGDPKEQHFKLALQEFYSELHKTIPQLSDAMRQAVAQDPQLSAVSSWESRAAAAAARAVNQIHACAREDAADPLCTSESIQKVLTKIALAASGETAAKENPARALDSGMLDILVDQFGISVDTAEYKGIIGNAIGTSVTAGVVFQEEVRTFASLNTFFHVDREISAVGAGDRGVVITASPFKQNDLGFKPLDLLSEFLIPVETLPDNRRPEAKALLNALRKAADFVLVELGADCDHAQNIHRTRRYLLGLEVPLRFAALLRFPTDRKLRSDALELLGPWTIDGKTFFLLVSCRRFWVWQKRDPHPLGKVRYRLRSSVVSKLLHRYSTFHSRPGIVEFQSGHSSDTFLYFAYGSNMLTKRLKTRTPSAIVVSQGFIKGYRIAFDKASADGSGKCNIKGTDNLSNLVHGVVYSIDIREKNTLDKAEGTGYTEAEIQVTLETGVSVTAIAYVADTVNAELRPYDWYKKIVVAGALEHKLPDDYVKLLRNVDSIPDPDPHRSAENNILLAEPDVK